MLAREDVTGAAHVGGELVDFVEFAIDDGRTNGLLAQIAHDEIVGFGFRELRKFEIDAADPEAFALKPFNDVAGDETAGAADKCRSHELTLANVGCWTKGV